MELYDCSESTKNNRLYFIVCCWDAGNTLQSLPTIHTYFLMFNPHLLSLYLSLSHPPRNIFSANGSSGAERNIDLLHLFQPSELHCHLPASVQQWQPTLTDYLQAPFAVSTEWLLQNVSHSRHGNHVQLYIVEFLISLSKSAWSAHSVFTQSPLAVFAQIFPRSPLIYSQAYIIILTQCTQPTPMQAC